MNLHKLLELFNLGKTSAKSHIKNLLEMASADGKYANEENDLLLSIAARNGISKKAVEEIKSHPDTISFHVPNKEGDRFRQLYDLVHMMIVDNDIHPEEVRLSELFASRMAYPKAAIKGVIDTIKQNILHGNDPNETYERVVYFLKFKRLT